MVNLVHPAANSVKNKGTFHKLRTHLVGRGCQDLIHFFCELHAKWGEGGPITCENAYIFQEGPHTPSLRYNSFYNFFSFLILFTSVCTVLPLRLDGCFLGGNNTNENSQVHVCSL